MPRARIVFICVTALLLTTASVFAQHAKGEEQHFKVGVANRAFTLDKPYNWRGANTHALITTIWYPASAVTVEQPQWIGPPERPLFSAGKAAPDAKIASAPAKFPLIVLSHGTGGSALMMAWLGSVLAARGYVAVAVNHPGNNALDGYTVQGFSTWWERARDLSTIIDQMLADSAFGGRIDPRRIGAAGFSLGGYTMIEIAGGITDLAAFTEFCNSPRADGICKSPPEFPTLFEDYERLTKTDLGFQESLRHSSDSYRDARIRAVFAIAPALGPAFRPDSLEKIPIPVEIVAGAADENVPIASGAKYLAAHIPAAELTIYPGGVGHYVFLDACTEQGRKLRAGLCTDAAGVDRETIHAKTVALALKFFRAHLR